jgi:hypothetical protein
MVSDIETIVEKTICEDIIINLANDIASIPFYFDKDREDEYEWLMGFICYSCLINSFSYDNTFHINLINKWNSLNADRKDTFYSIISNKNSSLLIVNSIQDLTRINSRGKLSDREFEFLTNKIECLLLKFAEYVVSIDKYISESETEKLNNLKNIIITSKTLQAKIDYKEYLNNKLNEIGFDRDNNELNISQPDEIRNLILKNHQKIAAVDREYIFEFLKLQKYLANQKDLIYKSIEILKLQEDVSFIDTWIDVIKIKLALITLFILIL